MKRIIWKIVKYILLFVFLYLGFFMVPATFAAFKVGFQTHDADLAGQHAAEVGEMIGIKYGNFAFWVILIFCIVLCILSVYKEINKINEGVKK